MCWTVSPCSSLFYTQYTVLLTPLPLSCCVFDSGNSRIILQKAEDIKPGCVPARPHQITTISFWNLSRLSLTSMQVRCLCTLYSVGLMEIWLMKQDLRAFRELCKSTSNRREREWDRETMLKKNIHGIRAREREKQRGFTLTPGSESLRSQEKALEQLLTLERSLVCQTSLCWDRSSTLKSPSCISWFKTRLEKRGLASVMSQALKSVFWCTEEISITGRKVTCIAEKAFQAPDVRFQLCIAVTMFGEEPQAKVTGSRPPF